MRVNRANGHSCFVIVMKMNRMHQKLIWEQFKIKTLSFNVRRGLVFQHSPAMSAPPILPHSIFVPHHYSLMRVQLSVVLRKVHACLTIMFAQPAA